MNPEENTSALSLNVREEREGMQFERMFRLLAYLLRGWHSYRKENPGSHEDLENVFRAIYFDKFVMVVARIWNQMFSGSGASMQWHKQGEPEPDSQDIITFPFPTTEQPGLHGPGQAVTQDGLPPSYIVEILLDLQEEGILPYFNIEVPKKEKGKKKEETRKLAGDPRTTVKPALPEPVLDSPEEILKGFSRKEVDVLKELRAGLKHLSAAEMRSLGTHENAAKTLEYVLREFEYMRKNRKDIIDALRTDGRVHESISGFYTFAEESSLKSISNHGSYEDARHSLSSELEGDLKEALLDTHDPSERIWNDDGVQWVAKSARKVHALARYLRAIGRVFERDQVIPTSRFVLGKLKEAAKGMVSAGYEGFPYEPDQIVEENSARIRPTLVERLIKEFQGLVLEGKG